MNQMPCYDHCWTEKLIWDDRRGKSSFSSSRLQKHKRMQGVRNIRTLDCRLHRLIVIRSCKFGKVLVLVFSNHFCYWNGELSLQRSPSCHLWFWMVLILDTLCTFSLLHYQSCWDKYGTTLVLKCNLKKRVCMLLVDLCVDLLLE